MAKISAEVQRYYNEKTRSCQETIASIIKGEEEDLLKIRDSSAPAAEKYLDLCEDMLFLTSNYLVLSGISRSMLKLRNERALNDARKSVYKAVIYLEKVVSPYLDVPFSEYEGMLADIAQVSVLRRYSIIRKMGLAIHLLKNGFGNNTKWKWAFVELEGRYAAVAKNIVDLKTAVSKSTDPYSPDHEPMVSHLRLVKKLLLNAADHYRQMYELSTSRIDDFRTGMEFLAALKRIHILFWEQEDAETIKKKSDVWHSKLEKDRRKKEEAFKQIQNG